MTVSVTVPLVSYSGAGTAGPFAIPFRFLADADLVISKISATGVETTLTGNTIAGAGDSDGGELYTAAAVAVGDTLQIHRATVRAQTAQYVANGPFPAATHERALDKAMLVDQEQDRDIGRAVKSPLGETGLSLAPADQLAGNLLMASGDGEQIIPAAGLIPPLLPASVLGALLLASASPEAAQIALAGPLPFYYVGSKTFAANTTVTSPVTMLSGAVFTINNGVTLTLPPEFSALGGGKIFNCIGTGRVLFSQCPKGGVDPRWWGLLTCDLATIQSAPIQTANVAAFTAANASITSGHVSLGFAGRACFNDTLPTMDATGKGVRGMGEQITDLMFTHAGAMLAGGTGTSAKCDCIFHEDFTAGRPTAPVANTVTDYRGNGFADPATYADTATTPPTLAQLKGMAVGLILIGAANPKTNRVRYNDNMIGIYGRHTTGWDGERPVIAQGTVGTVNDTRVGVYLDGRGVAAAGTSMNGSFKVQTLTVVNGSFLGLSYGIVRDGRQSTAATYGDIRDTAPRDLETSGLTYGEVNISSGLLDENSHSHGAWHDTSKVNCMWFTGYGPVGTFQATKVRLTTVNGAGQAIFVQGPCHGSIAIDGSIDGASAYAVVVAVGTAGAVSGVKVSGSVRNVRFVYVLQTGAEGCHMGPFEYFAYPGQGAENIGVIQPGAENNFLDIVINNGEVSGAALLIQGDDNRYLTPMKKAAATWGSAVSVTGVGNVNVG